MNAFAKAGNGGNPAGVVLNADTLSERDKQKIAARIGFSETAFVKRSNDADFKVDFFTPNRQVDLCGHATIAAFYLMMNKEIIHPGNYAQETKAGILSVECRDDGVIYMDQQRPQFYEMLDKKEIADSLNISEDEIMEDVPVQIVSTGLKDIFIPVKSLKALYNIRPGLDKVSYMSKKWNVSGYHVFTLETECGSTAQCRNFAPLYGIPEEAATGTSTGALSCYLYRYGLISEKNADNLAFEQGYSMNRPSEILARLIIRNKQICEVKVGGIALNIQERELTAFI